MKVLVSPRHVYAAVAVVLLMLLAATAMVVGQSSTTAEDDAPRLSVRLNAVETSFDNEAWKYNQEYLRGAFSSPEEFEQHMTNTTSSYFSAMGYKVRLEVEVIDEAGQPVSDPNVNMTASATAWDGSPVEAFVLRESSDSPTFFLDFDVDGAKAAGPDGKPMQWFAAGFQTVDVEIFEDTTTPGSEPIALGGASLSFVYDRPEVSVGIDLPREPQKRLPESLFRLFNDLGWSDHVTAIDQPVPTDANVTLSFDFAYAADREATLAAFIAYRGVPEANQEAPTGGTVPIPHVPGVTDRPDVQNALGATDTLVVVERQDVATKTVDSSGAVSFSVNPSSVTESSALVLFAIELDDPAVPAGEPRGGSGVVVGAHSALLPVVASQQAENPLDVISLGIEGPGLSDSQEARNLNQLTIRLRDPVGDEEDAARGGDMFAVLDDSFQSQLLSKGSLGPDSDPQRPRDRSGSLPTQPIQEASVNRYRVYSVLYDASDQFYSMTYADRGFALETSSPLATTDEHARLFLNVTSWTTNYDNNPSESLFQITVRLTAYNEELNLDYNETVTVAEAGFQSEVVDVSPSGSPGTYEVTIRAYTGDADTGDLVELVRFVRPEPERGFVDRIPGFEVPALLAATALALAWVALRRRDD